MKLNEPPKNTSIQWVILRQQLMATMGTVVTLIIVILIASLFISEFTGWQDEVEGLIGLNLYSIEYYIILALIFITGIILAFFYTLFIGFPLGRELKKNLHLVNDGAEAFSRGRLDHRIKVEGINEISKVGQDFNKMADRIEKQVDSLQRLVDENVRLVNQTKITAALDERRNLARELHDAVSQELFAVSMTLSALPKLIDSDKEKAKLYFAQVEGMVSNAQQELRALIMHLRPVTLEGNSLYQGLQQLLNELQQKHPQIEWKWTIEEGTKFSQGVEDQLFRVVQEGISNMLRHSKATVFSLKISQKQERVILLMEDNGIGFDITDKKTSSYGISNMKERIEEIGGRLDIIAYPNKGTRYEIRVPLKI